MKLFEKFPSYKVPGLGVKWTLFSIITIYDWSFGFVKFEQSNEIDQNDEIGKGQDGK